MRDAYHRMIKRELDLEIIGEADNGRAALEMIASAPPHLVLVDISLPGMSGITLITHLRTLYPDMPVIIISAHEEALYAKHALQAGAKGYLVKARLAEVMIEAIHQVLNGEVYISDAVRQKLKL